uniref:Uncharacterized protein n=1 Tax=Anguilla anguilla TaxID=7936 RepID=A0A0E9SYU1_ANGAN
MQTSIQSCKLHVSYVLLSSEMHLNNFDSSSRDLLTVIFTCA